MAQHPRKIFIINKRFQFRFALYVCSWLVALSFVYPLIVYTVFDYFIRYAALDPNGPSLQALHTTRHEVLIMLVLLQLIFLAMSFLVSIFMSHRIAGPLYKLSLFFERAKAGDIKTELFFREKDHFQEIAGQYNDMIRGLRERFDRDSGSVSQAIADVEKVLSTTSSDARPAVEKALSSLRSLQR